MTIVIPVNCRPLLKAGLIQILSSNPDIRVDTTYSYPAELRGRRHMVAVLDVGRSAADALKQLTDLDRLVAGLPVLVIGSVDEELGLSIMRHGAAGYISESCTGEELVAAIIQLAHGNKYMTAGLTELMLRTVGGSLQPSHLSLSCRELEVLLRLIEGASIKQLSTELQISTKTVSTYKRRILDKLHLQSTCELLYYAIQHRLTRRVSSTSRDSGEDTFAASMAALASGTTSRCPDVVPAVDK